MKFHVCRGNIFEFGIGFGFGQFLLKTTRVWFFRLVDAIVRLRVLVELGDVDTLGDVSCQGLLQLKRPKEKYC
jgi:hypothetical protein